MNFYLNTEIEWKDYSPFYDYSFICFYDFRVGNTYFKKGQLMNMSYFHDKLNYYIGDRMYDLIDTVNGSIFEKEIGISFDRHKLILDPINDTAIYFLNYTQKIKRKVPVYKYTNFGTKEKPRYVCFHTGAQIVYLLSKNKIVGFEFKNYKQFFNKIYPIPNSVISCLKRKFKNLNLRPCETSTDIYSIFNIDRY